MNRSHTAVFDIIGTCFSLEKTRQALLAMGAPETALDLWFAETLRDFFAFSHAGGYASMKKVLEAELGRTLGKLGIEASDAQRRQVVGTFAELDPRPDLSPAVDLLSHSGWRVLALTNGSDTSTRALLERAGIANRFADLASADSISISKPNRALYELARSRSEGVPWMVAAHAWDIAGAALAGMHTAFITSVEGSYLDVYPLPDIVAPTLLEAARAMIGGRR